MRRALRMPIAAILLAACTGGSQTGDVPTAKVARERLMRRVTADGKLKAVDATAITAPIEAQVPLKIGWVADDGTLLKKGDPVFRFDPTELEKNLLDGRTNWTQSENKIVKEDAQALATRTNLGRDATQAELEMENAKKLAAKDAGIFSRFEIIESQIDEDLAGERRDYAEQVRSIRDRVSRANRDLLVIEQRKADIGIKRSEAGLRSLTIVAPHDGILVLKRDWRGDPPRVGRTVWSGFPLAEIPNLRNMEAEVYVLEADAGGLEVGQPADVTLDSVPGRVFKGKIKTVDPLAKPRFRGVPVQYFGVTVELSATDPAVMKPGAGARATLELGQRTPVIAVPRHAVFEKNGSKVVYRLKGGRFVAVPVVLGVTSLGKIEVKKGIAAGDVIALRDPTRPAGAGQDESTSTGSGAKS